MASFICFFFSCYQFQDKYSLHQNFFTQSPPSHKHRYVHLNDIVSCAVSQERKIAMLRRFFPQTLFLGVADQLQDPPLRVPLLRSWLPQVRWLLFLNSPNRRMEVCFLPAHLPGWKKEALPRVEINGHEARQNPLSYWLLPKVVKKVSKNSTKGMLAYLGGDNLLRRERRETCKKPLTEPLPRSISHT